MSKPFASMSFVVWFRLSTLCAGACVGAVTACATSETLESNGAGGGTFTGGSTAAAGGKAGNPSAQSGGAFGSGGAVSGVGGTLPSSGGAFPGNGGASAAGGAPPGSGGASATGGATSGGTTSTGGAVSSGGATGGGKATGGTAGSGGASATGGTASGGSSGSAGKATGGAGTGGKATGGAGGTGAGGKATGGAGTGGSGGCADGDGDGLTDCDETNDGSAWTDPAIFNGLHVQRGNQCSSVGNCNENDTQQEVNACMQNNIDEERDQHAGWDWDNPPDDICNSEYGFAPNWTGCDTSWAARWSGCIHFDTAGPHCFRIAGTTSEGCAALYFNGNTGSADAQTGTAVKCFNLAAGNYPLMFHYTMDNGSSSSMHVQYCDAQGGSTCTPTVAIPSRMLRTSCQ